MKYKNLPAVAAGAITLFCSSQGFAYEVETHEKLSRQAATQSARMGETLTGLALTETSNLTMVAPDGSQYSNTVRGWVIEGAKREDDTFTERFARYKHHFFDPISGQGFGGILWRDSGFISGMPAPTWILYEGEAGGQLWSFSEARQYFYDGLTQLLPSDRETNLAKLFRSLGDVMHVTQDMAQPQHTRNDGHGNGSRYEHYTRDTTRPLRFTNPNVSIPSFGSSYEFFSNNSKTGLADYSNGNFVSDGTNFGYQQGISTANIYSSPAPANNLPFIVRPVQDLGLPQSVVDYCNQFAGSCSMYFVSSYNSLGQTRDYTATLSIFASDLDQYQSTLPNAKQDAYYSLNRINFDFALDELIPRAVAYSAGMIDYFFRGKMEISLPDEGVYGILDHNDPASNAKDTGGFTKIKLKVKNVTPRGSGIEPMSSSGTLVAVAKFHRNNCYAPDLSGEYGSPDTAWNKIINPDTNPKKMCRGDQEEIAVSQPVAAPADINTATPSGVVFSFPKPNHIPINATDLFIQVVYRGPLGDEPDAVAVVTKDISEPTYLYNYSTWDQYQYEWYWPTISIQGQTGVKKSYAEWCTGGSPPGFTSVDACNQAMGGTVKWQYSPTTDAIPGYDPATASVPPGQVAPLAQEPVFSPIATLVAPVGTLARIAVLLDAIPANTLLYVLEVIDSTHQTALFRWTTGTAAAGTNQLDTTTNTLTPSVHYLPGRGVYLPDYENQYLTSGDAKPIPPLVLTPSQISPSW